MPFFKIIYFILMYTFFHIQLEKTPFMVNKYLLWITEFIFLTIFLVTKNDSILLFYILTALSFVDIKHYEIPSFSYFYLGGGVFTYILASNNSSFDYLKKVIIVFAILFVLDFILNLQVGGADLKLLIILIPLIEVFKILNFLYLLSFFAILTWVIKSIMVSDKKWSLKEPIPLIPAISMALFLVL